MSAFDEIPPGSIPTISAYTCPMCGERYQPPRVAVSCTVLHAPGTCCHFGETKVDDWHATDAEAMEMLRVRGWRTHAEREVLAAVLADVARLEADPESPYPEPMFSEAWFTYSAANSIKHLLRLRRGGAA